MSENTIKMAIKSLAIPDTEATEEGENKNPITQMQIQTYDAVKQCGRLGLYGLYSNAPQNSLVIVMQTNGQEECLLGLEDDVNNRPRGLAEGEVMLYNTITKSHIYLDKEGNINFYSQVNENHDITESKYISIGKNLDLQVGGNVNINVLGDATISAENTTITSNVVINGDLEVTGNSKLATAEIGNGASGTYTNSVTASKGIVTAGA